MIRLGKRKIGWLDWDSEDFTYGQRIELGNIFADDSITDYRKFCRAFKVLYGWDRRWLPMKKRIKVFTSIAEGLKSWLDLEQEMLKYTPTAEEIAAGVQELSKKVGSMATVKQLAKTYATDPDTILQWPYSKVFGILYTDLEERKYESKLSKEYENRRNRYKKA